MQECEMGIPRGAGFDTESHRMVARETEVIRATRIDEGEPAGRTRIPGVGRNLVEGGLQLRLERSDGCQPHLALANSRLLFPCFLAPLSPAPFPTGIFRCSYQSGHGVLASLWGVPLRRHGRALTKLPANPARDPHDSGKAGLA